jgi:hypothetical protein
MTIDAGPSFQTVIRADAAVVYMLVSELELWPALIPHIHSARVLQRMGNRRLVSVRASWHGVPVGWRAIQLSEPEHGRVTFRHLVPVSRGTTVTWTVCPVDDNTVVLRVEQQVKLARFVPGRQLMTGFLTHSVGPDMARSMLDRIREIAEGGSLAGLD